MATLWLSSSRHVGMLARSAVRGNGGEAVSHNGIAMRPLWPHLSALGSSLAVVLFLGT